MTPAGMPSPMREQRIGTVRVHRDAHALRAHCPALRTAAPALMLALFGAACSFIALASLVGLMGGDTASGLLALAFAGVFVLPLLGLGTLFIAVALWSAFNALTATIAAGELCIERRWCGLPLSKKSLDVRAITALDCVREARFTAIFGGARTFRLLARTPGGALLLADHLGGAEECEQVKRLIVDAARRPELAAGGRSEHLAAASESPSES
jgi:hypothetical protein